MGQRGLPVETVRAIGRSNSVIDAARFAPQTVHGKTQGDAHPESATGGHCSPLADSDGRRPKLLILCAMSHVLQSPLVQNPRPGYRDLVFRYGEAGFEPNGLASFGEAPA